MQQKFYLADGQGNYEAGSLYGRGYVAEVVAEYGTIAYDKGPISGEPATPPAAPESQVQAAIVGKTTVGLTISTPKGDVKLSLPAAE
jgi:hypothetical protein